MSKLPAFKRMSVQTKINVALLFIFALVLVAALFYSTTHEKGLILDIVKQQTKDAANAYFDSINTMMLTGTMNQREVLRSKVLDRPGMLDARIIRGQPVAKQFGAGDNYEQVVDDLDKRALAGEAIEFVKDDGDGRVLTVINPIRAEKNFRGTNCMTCHQVPEHTVMGAVRVSYSLKTLDHQVSHNVQVAAIMYVVLFALGLGLIMYVVRRVVIRRIKALHNTIDAIERDEDLSRSIKVEAEDEVGAMGHAFNRMIQKFRHSLQTVASSTDQLTEVSDRVANVAEETLKAVMEQRSETDMVASAMNEMSSTVQEVARNASNTAAASRGADDESKNGALVATEALAGIDALIREVENASAVIAKVENDSTAIGMVLDVIKGIAEQTNLLALNAAIEAARAGEQGRGFAVVADEVRTLASRTRQSTDEIQSMIKRLQGGAHDAVQAMEAARSRAQAGSDQVEKAAENLATIAGEVSTINDMNTQIATAAEEQSAVAEEVNRNITNISHIADKTSEGAKHTAQISEELVRLAAELQRQVSRFKL
jgi:methyl-accepting chemotaxis protein